jgi:hypothetical protein
MQDPDGQLRRWERVQSRRKRRAKEEMLWHRGRSTSSGGGSERRGPARDQGAGERSRGRHRRCPTGRAPFERGVKRTPNLGPKDPDSGFRSQTARHGPATDQGAGERSTGRARARVRHRRRPTSRAPAGGRGRLSAGEVVAAADDLQPGDLPEKSRLCCEAND